MKELSAPKPFRRKARVDIHFSDSLHRRMGLYGKCDFNCGTHRGRVKVDTSDHKEIVDGLIHEMIHYMIYVREEIYRHLNKKGGHISSKEAEYVAEHGATKLENMFKRAAERSIKKRNRKRGIR